MLIAVGALVLLRWVQQRVQVPDRWGPRKVSLLLAEIVWCFVLSVGIAAELGSFRANLTAQLPPVQDANSSAAGHCRPGDPVVRRIVLRDPFIEEGAARSSLAALGAMPVQSAASAAVNLGVPLLSALGLGATATGLGRGKALWAVLWVLNVMIVLLCLFRMPRTQTFTSQGLRWMREGTLLLTSLLFAAAHVWNSTPFPPAYAAPFMVASQFSSAYLMGLLPLRYGLAGLMGGVLVHGAFNYSVLLSSCR